MNNFLRMAAVLLVIIPHSLFAQMIPCQNGLAGNYPCSSVDLLSHLTPQQLLAEEQQGVLINDIWGWTDSDTGKEYAIVGMANGTSFVDISDPEYPLMLGILPEHHLAGSHNGKVFHDGAKSIWRDIKVYQNHAFIVSEDVGHGMQVFDLTDLRNVTNIPATFLEAGHYSGISNAHNIVINEDTGFAYAVGADGTNTCGEGGLHVINIQDPKNPVFEACFDTEGYVHDAQCVIYNGPDADYQGKEICFNSNSIPSANSYTLTVVDVGDKGDMNMISKTPYEGSRYSHQGWLTEDHKYYLANDELDEYQRNVNTTTYIWDVQDLDAPKLIGSYVHETQSIDHNLYIKDQLAYESNYTSGLRILDIKNIANNDINLLAYFDTYPANDDADFEGTWSNYPFFDSGVIAVSDITGGLFLVKISDKISTKIMRQPEDIEACAGDHINLPFRAAGNNLSYQWQINTGAGFEDILDFTKFHNTNNDTLHLHTVEFSQTGSEFRVIVSSPDDNDVISEVVNLTVKQYPFVGFTYAIEENMVEFTNESVLADSYRWDFGDGSGINGNTNPSHTYTRQDGQYTVRLIATNECGDSEYQEVISLAPTGLEELTEMGLAVYPLPATNLLTIRSTSSELMDYTIFNTQGLIILSDVMHGFEKQINLQTYGKGIYFLKIRTRNGVAAVTRIVIE